MPLTPREKLAAAMMRVTDPAGVAPYFGVILRGLVRREMDDAMQAAFAARDRTPTLAVTDNGVLYWSTKFVETVDVQELAMVLVHEAMHLVLRHGERAAVLGIVPMAEDASRAHLWNIAADMCINEEIRKFGKLPGNCAYPETFQQPEGLTTEERFRLLEQLVKKQQQAGKGGASGAGQEGKPKGGVASGRCGGCARHPNPGEATGDPEGRSEADLERFRKQTAEAVKDHVNGRGTVPASLERWADEMLAPPRIPWREKLARLVRGAIVHKSGSSDYTWSRMSRRQGGVGYGVGRAVLPAMHSPVPNVGVIIDTSGSMSGDDLTTAAGELRGVLGAVGAAVTVVACDARVHGVRECKSISEAVALFKGGGGTSMTPGFEALAEKKDRPNVVIVMTDGHIGDGYPEVEPTWCRTIWTIVSPGGNTNPCPWGEVVHVDES